ncbi:MAG: flagellar motor switch protein FliN [bacterium]|nr:flagellar motor switch protein FliN [bacterium]
MAANPEVMEYITSHAEKIISEAKEIIGTVVNKDVTIDFQGAEDFDFGNLSSVYSDAVVDVTFKLKSDPEGMFHLLIPKEIAAMVGSLMMMMEEEEPEFSEEEHVDAMKETVNQILGSISTNLKDDLGGELGFEAIEGQLIELSEDQFGLPDMITGKMQMAIAEGDPKEVSMVFTASSVEGLLGGEAATDAAEAVEDEEAPAEGEETAEGDEEAPQEITAEELAGLEQEVGEGNFEIEGILQGESEEIAAAPDMLAEQPAPGHPVAQGDTTKYTFLHDLTFGVSIELGRTKMLIKDILELGHGSVIEFDKLAGEPVDLLIDEKKIAEGEVVVIDEHFGIRITSLISKTDMLKGMKEH